MRRVFELLGAFDSLPVAADAGWPAIAVAALGSSALGAIFGGYITTWLRGRIEHDEAMRTRLIEAADTFVDDMSKALLALRSSILYDAADGRRKLRDTDGELTDDVADAIKATREYSQKAHTALTRVELLYSTRVEGPYDEGLMAVDCLNGCLGLLEGKSTSQAAVRAALLLRGGDATRALELLGRSSAAYRRAMALVEEGLPADEFSPDDDASVASWACTLRQMAADQTHAFVTEAQKVIHARHPGDVRGLQRQAREGWRARLGRFSH